MPYTKYIGFEYYNKIHKYSLTSWKFVAINESHIAFVIAEFISWLRGDMGQLSV